jgi:predicted transposase YdaD
VYSIKGDSIPLQIIDTRELPVEENLWLTQLDNRLDHTGARRIIRELDRENRAERMAAYIDAVYTANFEVMEEVSRMSDTTMVYGKTLENAGYVTRKMILAKIAGKEEEKVEIARNALAQGISIETVAVITALDIEKVREISRQGKKPWK